MRAGEVARLIDENQYAGRRDDPVGRTYLLQHHGHRLRQHGKAAQLNATPGPLR